MLRGGTLDLKLITFALFVVSFYVFLWYCINHFLFYFQVIKSTEEIN